MRRICSLLAAAVVAAGTAVMARPLAAQVQFYATPNAFGAAVGLLASFNINAPVAQGTRPICVPQYAVPGSSDGCVSAPVYQGFTFASAALPSAAGTGPLTLSGGPIQAGGGDVGFLYVDGPPGLTNLGLFLTLHDRGAAGYDPLTLFVYDGTGTQIGSTSVALPYGAASGATFLGVTSSTVISRFVLRNDASGPNDIVTLNGFAFTAAPEPSTVALTLGGLAVLGAGAWRRRRA